MATQQSTAAPFVALTVLAMALMFVPAAIAGSSARQKKTKEPGFFKPLNIRTIVDNSTFPGREPL